MTQPLKYIMLLIIFILVTAIVYSQSLDSVVTGMINKKLGSLSVDSSIIRDTSLLGKGINTDKLRINPNFVATIVRKEVVKMFMTTTQMKNVKPIEGMMIFNTTIGRWQIYSGGAWR